jgi:hypothetical protein
MELLNDPFIVEGWFLILLVVAPLILGLAIGWAIGRMTRQPESAPVAHQHTADRTEQPDPRQGQTRAGDLEIRELTTPERHQYAETWSAIRARFVDDPPGATRDADELVTDVMRTRGYPVDDPERLDAVINVFNPSVVEDYRSVHPSRSRIERGEADTEELRRTFTHYDALFAELTGERRDEVPPNAPVVEANGSVDPAVRDHESRIRS